MLSVGSLFSGIGGIDLGLEAVGMRVEWQCESDEFCRGVLARHWPGVHCYRDVREIGVGTPKVDVLAGGFPCQPVSHAGRRKGQGDERWLWPEFARAIGILRPRWVLAENVPGLASRGLADVLADLSALGYDAEWDVVSAASVGASHLRERIFIVAYPNGERSTWSGLHEGEGEPGLPDASGSSGGGADPAGQDHRGEDANRVADSKGLAERPGLRADQSAAEWRGRSGDGSGSEGEVQGSDGGPVQSWRLGWGAPQAGCAWWWTVEPGLGRSLDGFSSWLERSGMIRQAHELLSAYAHASGRSSAEAVRVLRSPDGTQEIQRAAGGCGGLSTPEILLAYVRELAARGDGRNAALPSPEAAWAALRSVRGDDELARASRRPGPGQQHAGEHSDALQAVSRLLARDAEAAWLAYRRSDACPPLNFEAGIARTAHGVPDRLDRLKAIGNAVVPQVAEYVGGLIVEAENA